MEPRLMPPLMEHRCPHGAESGFRISIERCLFQLGARSPRTSKTDMLNNIDLCVIEH